MVWQWLAIMSIIALKYDFGSRSAFTLVEAVASLAILMVLLSSIVVAFRRTVDSAYDQILHERAVAVAQRQIELLLASEQEPESTGLFNEDELDPLFSWKMELKRVAPASQNITIRNSVIMAKVTVTSDPTEAELSEPVELYRCFGTLTPKEGQEIAAPLKPAYEEEPWYIELKEKLGREPTQEEILGQILKGMDLSEEIMEEIGELDGLEDLDLEDLESLRNDKNDK